MLARFFALVVLTSFEPFALNGKLSEPCTVGLQCFPLHQENGLQTTVRGLRSQAAVQAALRATGLLRTYQLTKRYGRHAFDPGAGKTETEWAEQRSKLYDAWRAGTAPLCKRDGQLTPAAQDFISSLPEQAAASVQETLNWRLWRLLDPKPLPLQTAAGMLAEGSFRLDWPSTYMAEAWSPKAISEYGSQVAGLIADPVTRLETIERLWLTMRMARHVDELPLYVVCYCIWLNAESDVQTDSILGELTAGLYTHAERYFAQVRILPSESFSDVWPAMWDTSIPFSCPDQRTRCVVIDCVLCSMLRGEFRFSDWRKRPLREKATRSSLIRRKLMPAT